MPSTRPSGRTGFTASAGVALMFASNGALFASLLPWYPLIVTRLGLSAVEFGLIVASFAVGAIISSALPAPLLSRFGTRAVSNASTIALALALVAAAWAPQGWTLALALGFAGFFDAIADVSQNVTGIRVQDGIRRPILSSMHAMWSLGGLAGGAVAAWAATAQHDIRAHMLAAAVVGVLLVTTGSHLAARIAPSRVVSAPNAVAAKTAAANADSATETGASAHTPATRLSALRILLPLVAIAICGTMIEDIANNWAALSAVEIGGIAPAVAGIAFTVVIGSQCIGRFTGDLLIHRVGPVAAARIGGTCILVGGVLIVSVTETTAPLQLFIGLGLAGYGSATLVPSAFAAAAKIPGVSEGLGVTIISWLMRIGFLATSPLIGLVAQTANLRWALGVLIVIGAATVLLARSLAPRSTTA